MNILIFTQRKGSKQSVSLGPAATVFVLVCSLVLGSMVFLAGVHYGDSRTSRQIVSVKNQAGSLWHGEIQEQREVLQNFRQKTEKGLDAMAIRLSLLQGHILRLDALGARLASMANLEDMDFDVLNTPGMGGPENSLEQNSTSFADIQSTLDSMEKILDDRSAKLTAMESLLIDRALQEQILPEGLPALGGWMSSLYGYRSDPITGKKELHQGVDFAGKLDTPITAVAAGIVIWSGARYGYGNLVEISHGNGYTTRYAHNRKNLVIVGEKVEKGEIIALMGASGRSTGTHVHFEVLKNGRHVNPSKYLSLK